MVSAMPRFILLAVAILALVGCGGGWEGGDHPGYVTEAEFGEAWPFKVSEGVVLCGNPAGAVKFWTRDGTVYALNAIAEEAGDTEKMFGILAENPDEPGTFKSLGPIFDRFC
jgi:hypothetical protein